MHVDECYLMLARVFTNMSCGVLPAELNSGTAVDHCYEPSLQGPSLRPSGAPRARTMQHRLFTNQSISCGEGLKKAPAKTADHSVLLKPDFSRTHKHKSNWHCTKKTFQSPTAPAFMLLNLVPMYSRFLFEIMLWQWFKKFHSTSPSHRIINVALLMCFLYSWR